MLEVKNKKIAVIGLSRTGIASANMLYQWGAEVIVSDVKGPKELEKEIEILKDIDVEYELGGHGDKCLSSDMIVVSPGVPLDIPFFEKVRKKNIKIISEIELAYHFTEAKIIAITGTNGKTTTSILIGEILKNANIGKVKVVGNIGVPLISEVTGLTKDDCLVVEISSFQLETIEEFKPDISLYLNFTPDHLDRHKTIENYWLAKKRIFKNQKNDDFALVNYDDKNVMKAVSDFPGKIYNVSLMENTDRGIYLKDNQLFIKDGKNTIKVMEVNNIPIKGLHNVQNVSFAVLACYLSGIPINIIKKSVRDFSAVEHRLENICVLGDNILVIDDSKATNPDSAVKAIEAFSRSIILIAGGQNRDADFREWASVIQNKVKTLILLGETRFKMKEEALNYGFPNINIHIVDSMEEAVKIAFKNFKENDCLLLSPACPSWDMYSSYKERGRDFQDLVRKMTENI